MVLFLFTKISLDAYIYLHLLICILFIVAFSESCMDLTQLHHLYHWSLQLHYNQNFAVNKQNTKLFSVICYINPTK